MSFFNNYIFGSNEYLGRLYLIVSSLIIFGLITLYSISTDPLSTNSSFMRQVIFIIFSLFIFLILNQINVKTIHDNSTLIYIFSLFRYVCIIEQNAVQQVTDSFVFHLRTILLSSVG